MKNWNSKAGSGFTLVELLIVVAIISILASIATPNFLEAQARAKVSRVKADARSLATALESYVVDNNRYPSRVEYPAYVNLGFAFQYGIGSIDTRVRDMSRVTTPIAYISNLPKDVFEKGMSGVQPGGPAERTLAPPNDVLDYWTADIVEHSTVHEREVVDFVVVNRPRHRPGWAIVSVGPDGIMGQWATNGHYRSLPIGGARGSYLEEYDPTNGTVSLGNVYRFQSQDNATYVFH